MECHACPAPPAAGRIPSDAQLSGSKLDSGIPLTNLLARKQTRFPEDLSYFEVDVYEIHTDLLGGRIYAPEIHYDSRKDVNAFGVRLDHLHSQIAAIEKEAGIKATGLLDGMLPIVLTKEVLWYWRQSIRPGPGWYHQISGRKCRCPRSGRPERRNGNEAVTEFSV